MNNLRVLKAVQASKKVLPVWLSPFLAAAFVYLGQMIGATLLFAPAFILFSLLSRLSGGADFLDLTGKYTIFLNLTLFVFTALLVLAWVKWVEKRPISGLGFFVEKRPISGLGFFKEAWLKELGKGFLIGAGLFSLILLPLVLLGAVQLTFNLPDLGTLAYILIIIPFWILQGGTEELVTRAWLLPVVTYKSNLYVGIGLSSGLFGVLHLLNPNVSLIALLNIILFGIFASLYFLKTDNIWGLVGIHGAWNFVQGNIYGIQVSGLNGGASLFGYQVLSDNSLLTGGAFGLEASLVTSLAYIIVIAFLYKSLPKELFGKSS